MHNACTMSPGLFPCTLSFSMPCEDSSTAIGVAVLEKWRNGEMIAGLVNYLFPRCVYQ